jgi:hypothetical protein
MDKGVITFAKVLIDSEGRNDLGVTSDIYHSELQKLAKANKRDGESVEQAYVRLGQETETGALLLKAALWAPAPKQAPQDFADRKSPEPIGPAARELLGRAKNITPVRGT